MCTHVANMILVCGYKACLLFEEGFQILGRVQGLPNEVAGILEKTCRPGG